MRLHKPIRLKDAAALISMPFVGDENFEITGINEIHMVETGDLTFVDHPKYYDKALNSAATTILINKDVECPVGKALIISDDPFRDYNFLTRHFSPIVVSDSLISDSASVAEGTKLLQNVFLGNNVTIGKNCVLHAGVVIYDNCVIGDEVIIHGNTTIGSDAFYYKKRSWGYDKMHTCGRVVIEDKVEIGANCTIIKGVSGDTRIGAGTKIDCHVHIGHDTVVGKNCLFAAGVMIAGVTVIEDDVILWGQVGVQKDLVLAKGTVLLGQSGIGKNTEPGKQYFGSPALDAREKMKELAWVKRIPEMWEAIQKLKK
ncbi:MAG: LpxD N-terminal domain-containing protein [Bacteroidia bacterium]